MSASSRGPGGDPVGNQRLPVSELKARGRKHLSKAEEAERERAEIHLPVPERVKPPEYLKGKRLREEFGDLAGALIRLGVMSDLDADGIARYILARQNYLVSTGRLGDALHCGDDKRAGTYAGIQDKAFRQCRAAASDLGLTITSRCGLVLPLQPTETEGGSELYGD